MGQEVSFPSSAAALLFKLEQVTLLSSGSIFVPVGCGLLYSWQNIFRPVEERKGYIFQGDQGPGIVTTAVCSAGGGKLMLRGFCLHWNKVCAHTARPRLWALLDSPSHVVWEGWDHAAVACREKRRCHPPWLQG